jgi:hypothetical protein
MLNNILEHVALELEDIGTKARSLQLATKG